MTEAEIAIPVLALPRDCFGLVTHEQTVQENVYSLEREKVGSKLKPSLSEIEYSERKSAGGREIRSEERPEEMSDVGAPVLDNTGMTGKFDFVFPFIHVARGLNAAAGAVDTPDQISSTFDAPGPIGLQLRPEKRNAIAVVIEQIHKPSEN